MEPIDVAALLGAVAAFALFLSSSTSFGFGDTREGGIKLAGGSLVLLLALGGGALSVGIEGYRTLWEGERPPPEGEEMPPGVDGTLLAAVAVEALPGDSLRLRIVGPDRRPRVVRIAGREAELELRVIRWRGLAWWVGRAVSWEVAAVRGVRDPAAPETRGDPGDDAPAPGVRLSGERPLDAFEALAGWPGLASLVDARGHRFRLAAGAGRHEIRWRSAGPAVERGP